VAGETRVNPQKLKDVGTLIGFIIDEDVKHIKELGGITPNAGKFDAAQWIEDLFIDRRDAVTAHVTNLERALGEIKDGLIAIATKFQGVDSTNADAVSKFTNEAKSIITEMGKAEFQPVMSKSKVSYETGDNTKLDDVDSFDFSDPNHPKILDFDPKKVPGMEEWMNKGGLGKNDDKSVNLYDQADIKGKDIDLSSGPPDQKDKPDPNTGGASNSAADNGQPKLTEPKVQDDPEKGVDGSATFGSKDHKYIWYLDDNGNHQTHNGNQIWWFDNKPYLSYTERGGPFVEYHEGNDPPPTEPYKKNENNGAPTREVAGLGQGTYRSYDVDGKPQTHNGNEIWWLDSKPYMRTQANGESYFLEYHTGKR
jgi:hypothetical protein